jgi:hypothetical protein
MDIQLYNKIKASSEYRQVINLGFFDKTTPIQLKNGTLDFTVEPENKWSENRYTIYSSKEEKDITGCVRTYSHNKWANDLRPHKVCEMHISTYDEYLTALVKVASAYDGRNKKYINKFIKNKYLTVRVIFTSERRKISNFKDLYDEVVYSLRR